VSPPAPKVSKFQSLKVSRSRAGQRHFETLKLETLKLCDLETFLGASLPENDPNQPHLKRVLGRFDLVLLFVVAVFNLNVVPSIAANGGVTVWLWIISLLLFFWPQGIAVIELAHRYPGEGGVYLWAKEVLRSLRRFSRIPLRLVLLDQQHALCADGHALFRRRVGIRAGSQPSGLGRQ
jgi:hypothetical protein